MCFLLQLEIGSILKTNEISRFLNGVGLSDMATSPVNNQPKVYIEFTQKKKNWNMYNIQIIIKILSEHIKRKNYSNSY